MVSRHGWQTGALRCRVISIVRNMKLIDWRELYASNLAAIDAAGGNAGGSVPTGLTIPDLPVAPIGGATGRLPVAPIQGGTAPLPALPSGGLVAVPGLPGTISRPAPAEAPGWERLEYREGERGRPFHLYTPPDLATDTPAPLLVLLHGCTQSPTGFATAAAMHRMADRHGFLLLCPEQTRADNQQACWNWFLPAHQARGAGEPAFIAGAVRQVMDGPAVVDSGRVYVAGLSAGGAMATVMAAAYPDLFAAAAVHSGLAYRAATNLGAAFQAMTRGAPDPDALGRAALGAMGEFARAVPTIVVHGRDDGTVLPVNGEQAVRQWMATNRLAAPAFHAVFEHPTDTREERAEGGHASIRRRWHDDDGRLMQEYVEVAGLGHAWSGGGGAAFMDPRGPSASEAILAFFAAAAGYSRPATRAT
jgi:poly(hydroxyalkanoate) depolymerase family esterase